MSGLESLRDRVARALYENTRAPTSPWDEMPPERKRGWLSDADVVIPIVAEAAARVPDQIDPEKPANYLFKRERIGDAIRGLLIGWQDETPDLLDALRPFAEAADSYDDEGDPDDMKVDDLGVCDITLGHCRAARAILTKVEGATHDHD